MSQQAETTKVLAAIDVETTGLMWGTHEIIQIAVIPVDSMFKPIARFVSFIKPERPQFAHPKAMEVNGLKLSELAKMPHAGQIMTAFLEWKDSLFPNTQFGPIGHNYASFDGNFIKLMFGSSYDDHFWYKVRDSSILALGLQDSGILPVTLSLSLGSLAGYFGIKANFHEAYQDALASLEVYKALIMLNKESRMVADDGK